MPANVANDAANVTIHTLTRTERFLVSPINLLGRLGIVLISLALWCTLVLSVWIFLVLRAMATLAARNVVNIFRGAGTIDVARFEQVVVFWPRGLVAILRILIGDYDRGDLKPRHPLEAVQEALLAAAFYTLMIFSAEVAKDVAWVFLRARDWLTPHAQAAGIAALEFLRAHITPPF